MDSSDQVQEKCNDSSHTRPRTVEKLSRDVPATRRKEHELIPLKPTAPRTRRETGIDILGAVPWGTHVCQFYETTRDLIEILVPYFKTGLENNEACVWVTSDRLSKQDAQAALSEAVGNLDHYIAKDQIDFCHYSEWYVKGGVFDIETVLRRWSEKHDRALKMGFDGLRITGDTSWLSDMGWADFAHYESRVGKAIQKLQILAVCTYSLDTCSASRVIDVVSSHQRALIKRAGRWQIVENSQHKLMAETLLAALQQSEHRQKEVSALLEGSQAILKHRSFQDTAKAIFDSCKNMIGATCGYVALLRKGTAENEVLFLDSGGLDCTVDPNLPMPTRGLRGQAYKTKKTVYDNDFSRSKWAELMPDGHVSLKNVLFTPLMIDNEAVGLLGFANKPTGFTEKDARMAAAFGELASAALHNSRTMEALAHSRERITSVVETIPHAVYECGTDGIITWTNSSYARITGYATNEIVGMHIRDMMEPGPQKDSLPAYLKKLISEQPKPTPYFARNRTKDGRTIDVQVDWTYKRGQDGQVAGFVCILSDITERKEAQQELGIRNRILEIFLSCPDEQAYAEVLQLVLQSSKSSYGTFGYFDERGAFVIPSMTREIYWEKCNVPDKEIIFEQGVFRGVWAEAVRQKSTLYSNTGPFNTPKGHIQITNTMVTPILYKGEVISALHVANKPTDYDEDDKVLLETIARHIAPVLHARLQRNKAEREISRLAKFPSEDPNPVLRIAADGTILYKNRAAETFLKIWHRGDDSRNCLTEQWRQVVAEALDSGSPLQAEKPCGGRIFSLTLAPICDMGYVNLYALDITGRKQAQWALQKARDELEKRVKERTADLVKANEQLQAEIRERKQAQKKAETERKRLFALLERLPGFVFLVGPDYTIRFANRNFRARFGALEGRRCYEILQGRRRSCHPCRMSLTFESGKPRQWELDHCETGHIYQVFDYPFTDEDGSKLLLELGIDITELKEAQREIEMLAKFPSEDPNPVLRIAKGGLVIYTNEPGQGLLAYWKSGLGRYLPDQWRKFAKDVLNTGQAEEAELEYDGRIFSLTFAPVSKEDYVNIYALDITERRRLEKEVLEVSTAERQRIGQDLHDSVGQALVGIAFTSKMLEQKLARKSLPEAANAAEISKLIKHALKQTRSLAKVLFPVGLQAESILGVLAEFASEIEDIFAVNCTFQCEKPVLIHDNTAAMHLYHIVQEAVRNAIEHGKARNISITLNGDDGRITLEVKDDGLGLPQNLGAGKGMGLHIMRYRARMIGGAIEFDSTPDAGTILRCSFKNSHVQRH